jgi:hypothetical protein
MVKLVHLNFILNLEHKLIVQDHRITPQSHIWYIVSLAHYAYDKFIISFFI